MTPDEYLTARTDRSAGPDACHPWRLSVGSHGYGNAWDGRTVTTAHRLAWLTYVGPIPDDLTVDHLCANRRCANVRHLRLLSRADNARAEHVRLNRRALPCPAGHPPEARDVNVDGRAFCRECKRERDRRRYAARRTGF